MIMDQRSVHGAARPMEDDIEVFTSLEWGAGCSNAEDQFSFSALLNFDAHNDLCCPSTAELLLSPSSTTHFSPSSGNRGLFAITSSSARPRDQVEAEDTSSVGDSCLREKLPTQAASLQSRFCLNSPRDSPVAAGTSGVQYCSSGIDWNGTTSFLLKSVGSVSFSERMLWALSCLKESLGGGVLAQVWMPVKQGETIVLSTWDQPFLLDQALFGYREISRSFNFAMKKTPGLFPGLPGRVFMSGFPEWTSNVVYYNKFEYLRIEHAVSHKVQGSMAMPVFDPCQSSCCAVLEIVTTNEKLNFEAEMNNVCRALQAVDLRAMKVNNAQHQNLTNDQRSALSEILHVLRAICHAHMLPLALTWVPIACQIESVKDAMRKENARLKSGRRLCIKESACFVNDSRMQGFLQACAEHYLEKGQGIAGQALLSYGPFFCPDVKAYDIFEYPLAHHARKFGLQAAVAIRLRSTYTGDDDYILELFLPVNCKGSLEQQLLLNNLSSTMQRICKSLRTVTDIDAGGLCVNKVAEDREENDVQLNKNSIKGLHQTKPGSMKEIEKKRSNLEKHISLDELQKHFAGSLKDAAKNIGVCPTTLKRICRLHGISRWPSRKIKKVNRSLRKIKTVIDSVEGVEGAFRYDPETGCLVAAITPETQRTSSDSASSAMPMSSEGQFVELHESVNPSIPNIENMPCVPSIDCTEHKASSLALDSLRADLDRVIEDSHHSFSSKMNSSASSCPSFNNVLERVELAANKSAAYVVKATYKTDTVRFKCLPSLGSEHLYEEIGKRFNLSFGTFRLKYLDDEGDWVLLVTDSDLLECIEVVETSSSHNIKLQVLDVLEAEGEQ